MLRDLSNVFFYLYNKPLLISKTKENPSWFIYDLENNKPISDGHTISLKKLVNDNWVSIQIEAYTLFKLNMKNALLTNIKINLFDLLFYLVGKPLTLKNNENILEHNCYFDTTIKKDISFTESLTCIKYVSGNVWKEIHVNSLDIYLLNKHLIDTKHCTRYIFV